MRRVCVALTAVIYFSVVVAQLPPRFQVPGALLAGGRPAPFRNQRIQSDSPGPRPRRPLPPPLSNALPAPTREVRPVVEENQDSPTSAFDEEVNKLGISVLQSALNEAVSEEIENIPRPSPLPFRPERPVPVSRDNIREKPLPPPRPTQQVIRQELRQEVRQVSRPIPRQEPREENIPVRQPLRQTRPPPPAPTQAYRPPPPARAAPRPQPLDDDDEERPRSRKPQVQILSKYRTDNEDGSITWGFENDDGTFKEETLGIDCIIRGKYGYVDPDGVKREFSYEAGNQCDPTEEEEEAELAPQRPNIPQSRNKPQPQTRPQPQYSN